MKTKWENERIYSGKAEFITISGRFEPKADFGKTLHTFSLLFGEGKQTAQFEIIVRWNEGSGMEIRP